jgi:hypothetical protein
MGGHPLQRARGVEQLASGLNDGDAMLAHKRSFAMSGTV